MKPLSSFPIIPQCERGGGKHISEDEGGRGYLEFGNLVSVSLSQEIYLSDNLKTADQVPLLCFVQISITLKAFDNNMDFVVSPTCGGIGLPTSLSTGKKKKRVCGKKKRICGAAGEIQPSPAAQTFIFAHVSIRLSTRGFRICPTPNNNNTSLG